MLNESNKRLRDFPFTSIMMMLRLNVYYESKQLDAYEYELRNTARFVAKQKKSFKFDQVLLQCFNKIIAINDKMELTKILIDTRNELLILSKINSEAKVLEYFDFISWLESKIEDKSFADVLQQKWKNSTRIRNKESLKQK